MNSESAIVSTLEDKASTKILESKFKFKRLIRYWLRRIRRWLRLNRRWLVN